MNTDTIHRISLVQGTGDIRTDIVAFDGIIIDILDEDAGIFKTIDHQTANDDVSTSINDKPVIGRPG